MLKKWLFKISVNLRYKTVLMSSQKGVVMQRSSGFLMVLRVQKQIKMCKNDYSNVLKKFKIVKKRY